ncbi:hypothetical protein [Thermomonas sp.]|uniref:hypothetical protein n=1 Tax=Thermomonas sp. TaxID=1971895 RepID=UPI002620B315|nr:hypothetical protein [Thermomonas sp.]
MKSLLILFALTLTMGATACSSSENAGGSATAATTTGSGNDNACMRAAKRAMDQAYASLGSPAGTDFDALERITRQARGHMLDGVPDSSGSAVTASVLSEKIRIWVNCSGEEQTRDWRPG